MALDYIEELGIGSEEPTLEEDGLDNNPDESSEDLSLDSGTEPEKQTEVTTEDSKFEVLQEQIKGMEKRMADKDTYIQELKEMSKSKDVVEEDVVEEADDFWDDPEAKYKSMQEQMRVQQLQIQEAVYANTVDGYFKTVNPESLKEAVSNDTEFAAKFNSSKDPYKVAYEHLSQLATTKQTAKETSDKVYRDKVRAELLEEMKQNPSSKSTIPNINQGGSSNAKANDASSDGFASIFGQS